VLGLTTNRLDLAERLVTVDRQLQRVDGESVLTTPKAEKTRTIRVPGPVAFELRRHVREYRDDGPPVPHASVWQGDAPRRVLCVGVAASARRCRA
jgi:hypothetical protein